MTIRHCRDDEQPVVLEIINSAASAYRGVIPGDCWHEPYMALDEFQREVRAGVTFWGYDIDRALVGVMLEHLRRLSGRHMLVGTWAAAAWAVRFYRRHGFELVPEQRKASLLETYWAVPARQIEASVVLENPALEAVEI